MEYINIKDMTKAQIKTDIIGQTYSKELLNRYDWQGYYPFVETRNTSDGETAVIVGILNMDDEWNPKGCENFIVIDAANEYARDATDEEIAYHEECGYWPNTIMW